MSHHSVRILDDLIGPRRLSEARALARRKLERIDLNEFRKRTGLPREARSKGAISRALFDKRNHMSLGTLRKVVKAMGGELSIVLRFGDRETVLKAR